MFAIRNASGKHPARRALGYVLVSATLVATLTVRPVIAASQLNIGAVNSSPAKSIKRFSPLLEYLQSKGLPAGKVVSETTVAGVIDRMESGQVSFFFESAYGALKAMDEIGARPILVREKSGVKEYNSVIFVKQDSPIQSLEDLVGKVVAFEDRGSTSSFVLPYTLLENAGLELTESRIPIPGKVAYYFSKDDANTMAQVKRGKKAAAGGAQRLKVEKRMEFRILAPESSYVPRHVVMVGKDYDATLLRETLLNMRNDPHAKAVLKKIKTPTGFSTFDGDPVEVMDKQVRPALGL